MGVLYSWGFPKPAGGPGGGSGGGTFPLSISSNGRFLQTAAGNPFPLHGDTPWSIVVQLTDLQIDQYIDDRAASGFTAILFNAIEHYFSSQSPAWNSVDGVAPFSSMTNFGSTRNEAYWSRVDRIVNRCKVNNIVCIINPAYLGYAGTEEGWDTELLAETDADLQGYGAFLANRYTQGNVIWCFGGDADPNSTLRAKQWQIVTGIRSVRTTDIITAHGAPDSPAYATWNGQTGFNLNSAYPGNLSPVYSECTTEYGRAGPIPFGMIEAIYEQERSPAISRAGLRRQSYQAWLSGACWVQFGNNPVWNFEAPTALYSYSGTWESNLSSVGNQDQTFVRQWLNATPWWNLVPTTDTSLVSSSLSSGDTRICPALASDRTYAVIWVPSSQTITVVTNALTGVSGNVRIRRYDPTTGVYSIIETSVAKTSAQSVATGGEGVIVVDAG